LRLFVGDDWAEDHHDVELMDVAGRVLAKARLPEGIAGMTRLHAMVAEQLGDADPDEARVLVGIESDRGPWVAALAAAGYDLTFITGSGFARVQRCGLQICRWRPADLRTNRARSLVGWRTFAR